MSEINREFVTVLLQRSPETGNSDKTVSKLINDMAGPATTAPPIPGWQVVGFGWGNEFDKDEDGEDE